LNLALGQIAAPDQPPAASKVGLVSLIGEKSGQPSFNRPVQSTAAHPGARQIRQRVE